MAPLVVVLRIDSKGSICRQEFSSEILMRVQLVKRVQKQGTLEKGALYWGELNGEWR